MWSHRVLGCRHCVALAAVKVAFHERTLAVGYVVFRHLFVAAEVAALNLALGGNQLGVDMGVELVSEFIPIELLAGETQSVVGKNVYSTAQFSQSAFIIIIRSVALDVGLYMETLVKLFQKQSLVEYPSRGLAVLVDLPSLGDNAVLDDARVGNERVDAIGNHHRHRIAGIDGGSCVLLLFLTGDAEKGCKQRDDG